MTAITFQTGDGSIMVNATEMAKPFGKRPVDWLRLPSTEKFIQALSEVRKSHNVITQKGGIDGGGTLFHEDIALEFARWLATEFRNCVSLNRLIRASWCGIILNAKISLMAPLSWRGLLLHTLHIFQNWEYCGNVKNAINSLIADCVLLSRDGEIRTPDTLLPKHLHIMSARNKINKTVRLL